MAKKTKKPRAASQGSPPVKKQRVPDVIRQHRDSIVQEWLRRVCVNPELTRVTLSNGERRDHVPDLLDEAIAHSGGDVFAVEERQRAAERHGTLRYHQGYSVTMLILESQLLQEVIAECIRDNVHLIDINYLIPDIAKVSDTITAELRESARAYMNQYEWQSPRPHEQSARKA